MAKATIAVVCILAFAAIAQCEVFDIKGHIYCDPCKLGFQTEKSYGLKGATVELTCSSIVDGSVSYTQKAVTNDAGEYVVSVKNDHENEVCEVKALSSGTEDCKVAIEASARIECTEKSGLHSDVRFANPLGFTKDVAVAGCKKIVEDMDFDESQKDLLLLSTDELSNLL
ncbi:hypothetical protein LIER_41780 [Lithospermum erythrorhizon]|uniref:Uncharacterized protein n=1 Tax=Lithospermum erythrorhizon TaxID=34254 RepID=A0AAV3REE9_LITER